MKDRNKVLAFFMALVMILALLPVPAFAFGASPEVHRHTADCLQIKKMLICEDTSETHSHTEECYEETAVLICGKEEAFAVSFLCSFEDAEIALYCGDDFIEGMEGNRYILTPGNYAWEASRGELYGRGEFEVTDSDLEIEAILREISPEEEAQLAPQVDNTFVMNGIPGKPKMDVTVNGERRTVFCMQYDNIWPIIESGYMSPQTRYREGQPGDSLYFSFTDGQLSTLRRVLFAGYPYDALGILEPLYDSYGEVLAVDMASTATQAVIWTLMAEWDVPANTHWDPVSARQDFPEEFAAVFNALMTYAEEGSEFPVPPDDFVLAASGSTAMKEENGKWITGALTLNNPEGFTLMYTLTLPEGLTLLDKDKNPVFSFTDSYLVYGGSVFYLQADNAETANGKTVSVVGAIRQPTDIKQYVTDDTVRGVKEHDTAAKDYPAQQMLSVGILEIPYSARIALTAEETVSVSVSKVWDDANDRDGHRPTTVTVYLYANEEKTEQYLILEADDNGLWADSFDDLPKKANGVDIVYTVKEETVDRYTSEVSGENGVFTITNTHTPETADIIIRKVWNDDDDRDGLRPDALQVELLVDGTVIDTVTLSPDGRWEGVIPARPVFANGQPIVYSVKEENVDGYTSEVSEKNGVFTITNTHTPAPRGSLTVTKTVAGASGDQNKEFTFTVELSDRSINGSYGDLTFTDGTAVFTLKHKEAVTASGLPAGITYKVTEKAESAYVTTKTGDTGTIPDNDTVTAAFTNTRSKDNPGTGDDSRMALWVCLLVMSAAAVGFILVSSEQNGKKHRRK